MNLLDRKLLRDIVVMRGQIITIALVVAAGVGVFVASVSTYQSLQSGRDRFYASARFPQVFASLKRAPLSIVAQIAEIPGIAAAEPRIVRDVIVDWPSSTLPVSARIISLVRAGDEQLAGLHFRRGRGPESGDTRGAAINEAFAEANTVEPGQDIRVVLNGRLQSFRVTGIALSAEYVYAVKPGLPIPDDRLFAILWIDRTAAEAAFDMTGAFNNVVVSIAPGTDPERVIAELDRLLEPYGSVGAVARRDQASNRFFEDELNQQRVMSTTIPLIFFGVAAFLLNVLLGRLVAAQREQIAALKALGFPSTPLVLHFLKLVAIIVLFGSAAGIAVGIGLGHAMIGSYHAFFRLPVLAFELALWSTAAGAAVSFAAAALGVVTSLRSIIRLTPAEAMRPEAPVRFRRFWTGRLISATKLRPRQIMVLRNITSRPWRTTLTVIGLAFAVPMVVLGLFWHDAIERMVDVQFNLVARGNTTVVFVTPRDSSIIRDLAREPGVLAIEGERIVPVRLRAGHRSYLTSVIGLSAGNDLRRPHDTALRPVAVPPEGIMLTRRLAERLGVIPGDLLTIEVMEGRRRRVDTPVSATVDETIGMASYMQIDFLNRLTGEGNVVSAAEIHVEPSALPAMARRFKDLPVVESVAMKSHTLASFLDKIAGLVFVTAGILSTFAVIIAVGVVYNSARIGLQERGWELASLRVLGFTRAEVSSILFGEFIVETAVGIPLGLWISHALVQLIARFHSNESFQIPGVIEPRTYAAAAIVVVAAAAASTYAVRRKIDHLDLVAVLKTRD